MKFFYHLIKSQGNTVIFMINAKKSRKKLYGTIVENLEDKSKNKTIKMIDSLKSIQNIKIENHSPIISGDKYIKQSRENIYFNPNHCAFGKYKNMEIKHNKIHSKIHISYNNNTESKNKIYFGSKTKNKNKLFNKINKILNPNKNNKALYLSRNNRNG